MFLGHGYFKYRVQSNHHPSPPEESANFQYYSSRNHASQVDVDDTFVDFPENSHHTNAIRRNTLHHHRSHHNFEATPLDEDGDYSENVDPHNLHHSIENLHSKDSNHFKTHKKSNHHRKGTRRPHVNIDDDSSISGFALTSPRTNHHRKSITHQQKSHQLPRSQTEILDDLVAGRNRRYLSSTNNHLPVFQKSRYAAEVAENILVDTSILSVS